MDKKAYFDHARREDWAWREYTAEEHRKLDRYLDAAGIGPGWRVLEPGCGTGRLTVKLAARVGPEGEVVAVDISPGMIRECRRRAGGLANVRILQMPVEEVSFPSAAFDAVFVLCAFPHFEDKARVLRLFQRLLAPGGTVTLAHLEGSRILNRMHRETGGAVKGDRIPPRGTMERLFGEAGLGITRFYDEDDGYLLVAVPAEDGS